VRRPKMVPEFNTAKAWLISANPQAESLFPHHEVIEVGDNRPERGDAETGDAEIDAQIDGQIDAEIDARNSRGGIPPAERLRGEWYAARAGRSLNPTTPSRSW